MNHLPTLLALPASWPRALPTLVLLPLLAAAAAIDVRTRRIPNWLTLAGIAFGLLYGAFMPASATDGLRAALAGMALGMAVMLPFYLMRVMGAGDVKLMGMVGAFLGPADTWSAVLGSGIAGGVLAIAYAIRQGKLRALLGNVARILHLGSIAVLAGMPRAMVREGWTSVGKLPFGLAIATGTVSTVLALHFGLI